MQTGKVYPIGKVRYNTWKKVFETEVTASTPGNQLLSTFQGNHGATTGNAETGQVQTFFGTAQIVAPENPTFVGTAALDSVVKKFGRTSLLLDGNSDYLTLPDSSDWTFGAENFTLECWVRFNALGATTNFGLMGQSVDGTNFWSWHLSTTSANLVTMGFNTYQGSAKGQFTQTTAGTLNNNQWYHLVFVRSGSNAYYFIDGISQSLTQNAAFATSTDLASTLYVGHSPVVSGYINGWLDEVRISKGIARWTANFTVPTSPYTADYQTPLLLHFAGTDGGTTTSNSGSRGRVGQSSLLLDGNSDYVTIPDADDWSFGTGNFTADAWVKFNDLTGIQTFVSQSNGAEDYWYLTKTSDHKLRMFFRHTSVNLGVYEMTSAWSGLVINTWYHIAFERTTTTAKIFIDGVSQTLTETTAFGTNDVGNVAGVLRIGNLDGAWFLNGQIDAVRITKGTALWSSDFTSPTTSENYAGTKVIPILNLQGDIDEQYMLTINCKEGYPRSRINGDSAANYGYQRLVGTDTTLAAARGAATYLSWGQAGTGNSQCATAFIYAKKGFVRTIIFNTSENVTGTTVEDLWAYGSSWNNTIDEITSILTYAGGDVFAVGSTISLYKRETV